VTTPPVTPPPVTPPTMPPVTPPITPPPVTPPGGAGGGSPGHNAITASAAASARLHLHKNGLAIKAMAVTAKPVGAPTFLHGEFVLTFNGGNSTLPPTL
jgi:hypothetical protein